MRVETRKQEIIRVAATLFKDKGYSAVTMRDLAKAMGIKAASLYNHINSKQDILKDIIISLAEEFTAGMATIMASQVSSLDKLNQIIALHVNIAGRNTDEMASLNNDWMHLEEKLEYYLQLRENYEANFRSIIKQGIATKEIIDLDPDTILFSILSTLRSLYLWIPDHEDYNPNQFAAELAEILLHGINK
ncbi:MAG: TetR/AcrR family transcriptional regulator [Flavobacteriaceae bacterium]|nr:TetR/AcrR family transcriptional regulator [Flavobacteriaceae bacterium]NNL81089.1 TetR/AcrR family transcriptional regulator [Flavobacteriaceae bacterium]